jgi:4-diphosphocytidyl-2-C-methyl-D-erythritol kinase
MANDQIVESAYAKINLTLEIIGKRRDGYHNLASVMQTVDLSDDVVISEADTLTIECDDQSISSEINLAGKAAQVLADEVGRKPEIRIDISKNIPVSGGLGGGSTDAAAVLRGLNQLWTLDLSLDELTEIAAKIGSDVPFLVRGGTSLVQGRGEEVTPIADAPIGRVLVLYPNIDLEQPTQKTANVFAHVTPNLYTRGNLTHKLAARIRSEGDCPPEFFFNQFGTIGDELFDGWSDQVGLLHSLGATDVFMCGAGPSMFTVPPSKELGTAWHLLLTSVYQRSAFLAEPVPGIREE